MSTHDKQKNEEKWQHVCEEHFNCLNNNFPSFVHCMLKVLHGTMDDNKFPQENYIVTDCLMDQVVKMEQP